MALIILLLISVGGIKPSVPDVVGPRPLSPKNLGLLKVNRRVSSADKRRTKE
jgi:hypothetical protein